MTGYENSPDYGGGGRGPVRWGRVVIALIVVAVVVAAIYFRPLLLPA